MSLYMANKKIVKNLVIEYLYMFELIFNTNVL